MEKVSNEYIFSILNESIEIPNEIPLNYSSQSRINLLNRNDSIAKVNFHNSN